MSKQYDRQGLSVLMESKLQPHHQELIDAGIYIGKLYTDHGFPIDIALSELSQYTKLQKVSILDGAHQWFIEHKRLSGATEKAIERQRNSNRAALEHFINKDETGVY